MRILPIVSIVPSPATGPVYLEVAGDFTQLFHGKEWIDELGTRYPFYTYASSTAPYGTRLLPATTFNLTGNELYGGAYTVYTKQSVGDYLSSELSGGNTRIRILQTVSTDGVGAQLTTGSLINISTYLFSVIGESDKLVLEGEFDSDRSLEFVGRNYSGWGEIIFQNQIRDAQNFAGSSPPANPFIGQFWFNSTLNTLYVYNGSWLLVNATAFGAVFRHTQTTASTSWVIDHGLGERVVEIQTFKNTGLASPDDIKIISPNDVTFNSATQLTVTFSNAETGYALVRI